MNNQILSENFHSSSLFNPKLDANDRHASRDDIEEYYEANTARVKSVKKTFKKSATSLASSALNLDKNIKSLRGESPASIIDRRSNLRQDKNFKPFELIDSYMDTKRKLAIQCGRNNSLEVIRHRLNHNENEKSKYVSFFTSLSKTNLTELIDKSQKWNKKLSSMPKVKLTLKNVEIESEDEGLVDVPNPPQMNLMMRQTAATNSLLDRVIKFSKKYDLDKIMARWIPPSSTQPVSDSFIETRQGGAMAAVGARLYITGGFNNSPCTGLGFYDTTTNTFGKVKEVDDNEVGRRINHSMVAFRQNLYMFGGETLANNAPFSSRMTCNTLKVIDTSRLP